MRTKITLTSIINDPMRVIRVEDDIEATALSDELNSRGLTWNDGASYKTYQPLITNENGGICYCPNVGRYDYADFYLIHSYAVVEFVDVDLNN